MSLLSYCLSQNVKELFLFFCFFDFLSSQKRCKGRYFFSFHQIYFATFFKKGFYPCRMLLIINDKKKLLFLEKLLRVFGDRWVVFGVLNAKMSTIGILKHNANKERD
jgi:hypothetical protein